jgi:hypothetical protein
MSWELPGGLPPGRLVVPEPGHALDAGEEPASGPALWVSDDPVPGAGPPWARLLAAHSVSGLWPLLLTGLVSPPPSEDLGLYAEKQRGDARRPWHAGELVPVPASRIDDVDAAGILAAQWRDVITGIDYGPGSGPDEPDPIPYDAWPGLADPGDGSANPDETAAAIAMAPGGVRLLTGHDDDPYLGLTHSFDGAGAITASGWMPPRDAPEEIAAVVRSWQERFGVRLCSLGFDTVGLSVAWPPRSHDHAQRVAAEHFAFCPDLEAMTTFGEYTESLAGNPVWRFWWD